MGTASARHVVKFLSVAATFAAMVAVAGLGVIAARTAQLFDAAGEITARLDPPSMDQALLIDQLSRLSDKGHEIVVLSPLLLATIGIAALVIPIFLRKLLRQLDVQAAQEKQLRESEGRLREITNHALDAIVMIDDKAKVAFWNPAAEALFGYSTAEALGRDVHDLISPEDVHKDARTGMAVFARNGTGPVIDARREVTARRADGTEFRAEMAVGHVLQNGRHCAVGIVRDVTAQHLAAERLREMATIDALTGLRNRAALLTAAAEETARAVRYNRPLTVMALDIDHFKVVNDTYGHAAGDEVLRAFARTVDATLRSHDIVGRTGGEEFVVVLPETTANEAELLAMRLRRKINAIRVPFGSHVLAVRVSIGISDIGPHDGADPLAEALQRADTALYAAKRSGRDRHVTMHAIDAPASSSTPVDPEPPQVTARSA